MPDYSREAAHRRYDKAYETAASQGQYSQAAVNNAYENLYQNADWTPDESWGQQFQGDLPVAWRYQEVPQYQAPTYQNNIPPASSYQVTPTEDPNKVAEARSMIVDDSKPSILDQILDDQRSQIVHDRSLNPAVELRDKAMEFAEGYQGSQQQLADLERAFQEEQERELQESRDEAANQLYSQYAMTGVNPYDDPLFTQGLQSINDNMDQQSWLQAERNRRFSGDGTNFESNPFNWNLLGFTSQRQTPQAARNLYDFHFAQEDARGNNGSVSDESDTYEGFNYTQEKPIMVLSENENLNSNGNNCLNNFNIFENCNLNNTTKNTIYQHKNLIENFSSNNNNEKKENKTNSHIIHFTKIIKKTINKKKFIKTKPINNSIGNISRETDNHFIIRNKNINKSELIKENNNINIKEQPIKLIYKTNSEGNENLNQQNTNNNNDNYNENINHNNNKENNTINNIVNNNINGKKEEIQKEKNGIPIIKKSKNISIMNKIKKTEKCKISFTTNKTLNEIEKDIKSYILENMFNKKKSPSLLPTESPRVAIKPILLDYNQSTISNLEEPLELEKSSRLSSISNINHSNKEYQLIKNENNKF